MRPSAQSRFSASSMRSGLLLLALASTALALSAQSTAPSNLPQGRVLAAAPSSADPVIAGFEQRVHQYLDLAGKAAAGAPKDKPTKDIDTIDQRRKEIAAQVMAARPAAKQGDIFTPDAAALFRRLLAKTLAGPEGARIRASLRRAEPVTGPDVKVNQSYPNSRGVPLQSTPPSLLLNLPPLPQGIEYRVIDHALLLRDAKANIVVDYLPNAFPRN